MPECAFIDRIKYELWHNLARACEQKYHQRNFKFQNPHYRIPFFVAPNSFPDIRGRESHVWTFRLQKRDQGIGKPPLVKIAKQWYDIIYVSSLLIGGATIILGVKIPVASIPTEEAQMLGRWAKRGKKITINLSFESRKNGTVISRNTILELKGR